MWRLPALAGFTGAAEGGVNQAELIIVSDQSYSNLRSFEDPLNDDLSLLPCYTDVP